MTDLWFGTSGPRNAEIMVIGEAWGEEEEYRKLPLVGQSGQEFTRILADAGIARDSLFLTNLTASRPYDNEMWRLLSPKKESTSPSIGGLYPSPPLTLELDRLDAQIKAVAPKLIIALGNYPLWYLTDQAKLEPGKDKRNKPIGTPTPKGISNLRGSMLFGLDNWRRRNPQTILPVLPIYHPAFILRNWSGRAPTVHDLKTRVPMALSGNWRPRIPPRVMAPPLFEEAIDELDRIIEDLEQGPIRFCSDIETCRGLMTCIGFTSRPNFAMTIPWIALDPETRAFRSYWSVKQEAQLVRRLRHIYSHKNTLVEGQNFIYDIQYIARDLGVVPKLDFDTMLAHHLLFPGTPKSLDYLSSLYCEHHWYWKDDNKEWDTKGTLSQHLLYNSIDVLRQYECGTELRKVVSQFSMERHWEEEKENHELALDMTLRGVRINTSERTRLSLQIADRSSEIQQKLARIVPQSLIPTSSSVPWYNSPAQTKWVLYTHFGLKPKISRKTGNESTGKEALHELEEQYPRFKYLFSLIAGLRSLGIFQNTFIKAGLYNGRIYCTFNPGGTETFRWSSNKNAFGFGTNLQNIPSGNED